MELLIQHAILLMKSLKKQYGNQEGQNIFEKVCEALPDEVCNNLIETILKTNALDNYDFSCEVSLYVSNKTTLELNRVNFVKQLRYHTDYSLKKAVDVLKLVISGSDASVIVRKEIHKVESEFFKCGVSIKGALQEIL